MRVIAGSAKRIQLTTPKGMDTRPTTDRIKETLFNILMPELRDARFLDLFAGSGGIGIEALSRGASEAVFVDRSRDSVRCIEENLKRTHLAEKATVLCTDVSASLPLLEKAGCEFDIIFMDPPYRKRLEAATLKRLAASGLLHEDSLVIMEMALDDPLAEADLDGFSVTRITDYKTNRHIFLKKRK